MKNNFLTDFNKSRTPFFKSLGFLMIEAIIPGLLIWFTVGFDFNWSLNNRLTKPAVGYVSLICTFYFIYSLLITYLFYKLKWHQADHFTFSMMITLVFVSIIMFGSFIQNKGFWVLVKFISILLIVVFLTPLFVLLTTFIRNNELRNIEDLEKTIEAHKKGEVIPTKALLKAQRYQKFLIKKEAREQELIKFKLELDEKIRKELEIQKSKEELKKDKINQKLDAKEDKKRKKQKD
ncbi:DxFTY motif-containing membrane protein [Spiroplasma endosymbiont of Diplazon laetatorius]|uniref:DxFTY motif-containing membrane protein n=1 Tax=Spiroplasma endosymbiont of Diplazon laetatorius TaxID=3066322 RepID=UPI0030D3659C